VNKNKKNCVFMQFFFVQNVVNWWGLLHVGTMIFIGGGIGKFFYDF